MRPKKIVVLIDEQETRRRVRSFVLWTRGFRVVHGSGVPNRPDSLRIVAKAHVVLVDANVTERTLFALEALAPEATLLYVGRAINVPTVDVWMDRRDADSMAMFLDFVRIAAARKRGPKKPPASVGLEGQWEREGVGEIAAASAALQHPASSAAG